MKRTIPSRIRIGQPCCAYHLVQAETRAWTYWFKRLAQRNSIDQIAIPANTISHPGPGSGTSTRPPPTTMAPETPTPIFRPRRPAGVRRIDWSNVSNRLSFTIPAFLRSLSDSSLSAESPAPPAALTCAFSSGTESFAISHLPHQQHPSPKGRTVRYRSESTSKEPDAGLPSHPRGTRHSLFFPVITAGNSISHPTTG